MMCLPFTENTCLVLLCSEKVHPAEADGPLAKKRKLEVSSLDSGMATDENDAQPDGEIDDCIQVNSGE